MRKAILILALVITLFITRLTVADINNGVAVFANQTLTFLATPGSLVGIGEIQLNPANDTNRTVNYTATSDTDIRETFGDAGVTASQQYLIGASTADADDDSQMYMCGGGAAGTGGSRGAFMKLEGNEVSGGGDARLVCGNSTGSEIELVPQDDANRNFLFNALTDIAHTLKFGDAGTTAKQSLTISSTTPDADDDSQVTVTAGGAFGGTRGAAVDLYGNENGDAPGYAYLNSGNVSGASVQITVSSSDGTLIFRLNSNNRWIMNPTGTLIGNGTGAIGWTPVSATDQACNTTCVTPCVFGLNLTAGNITGSMLACTDATSDVRLCAGAS